MGSPYDWASRRIRAENRDSLSIWVPAGRSSGVPANLEVIVRYALLIYSAPGAHEDTPLARSHSIDWVAYARAAKDAGILLGAEQLTPADTATSVRMRAEDQLLTDGPFMETKEHLLGFFLVDVPDLDTALEWASKMPAAAHGTIEVRAAYTGMAWQAVLD